MRRVGLVFVAVLASAACDSSGSAKPEEGGKSPAGAEGDAPGQAPAKTGEGLAKKAEAIAKQVEAADDAAPPDDGEPTGDAAQWACKTDEQCTMTCRLGAVSAKWLAEHQDADDCDDGCGWKSGRQACRDGECVTLESDGTIDIYCTKKPLRER